MRRLTAVMAVSLAACGFSSQATSDGGSGGGGDDGGGGSGSDAAIDAGVDAPPPCQKNLLTPGGGGDVTAQGWHIAISQPATLAYAADYVSLHTSTTGSSLTGGRLLLYYPGAVESGKAFRLEVVMLIEQVNAHNPFDSAAAIMGAFTLPVGTPEERSQMLYIDADQYGWADDADDRSLKAGNGYRTYLLAVDAAGNAQVTIDGTGSLSRVNFTINGTIAVGDQTNDAKLDSTLRIKSVTLLCPPS
jgi:hypothetical protein